MNNFPDQTPLPSLQGVMPEKTLTVLKGFSEGRLMYREVMNTLSLDSDETLFRLMAQADLPMPHLSDKETSAMISQFKQFLQHAGL